MPFDGSRLIVGAGTLYVAPIGSVEPTSVTGAWGTGWTLVGYTHQGSAFESKPKFAAIEVEEELWAIRQAATGAEAMITFALAETTAQNLSISLNAGFGTGQVTGSSGTNPDGSVWTEPPTLGTEARLMVGWDALVEGAAQPVTTGQPLGRILMRQALKTGGLKREARKGANFATYSCTFTAEKPSTKQPFRFFHPATMAS